MHIAYCPNCDHTQEFGIRDTYLGKKQVEMEKFCTRCGSPMIRSCPNCNSYRSSTVDKYCPDCGKPYK